jgi:1-phosphatidylinositol-4-phosphate 5-kinase
MGIQVALQSTSNFRISPNDNINNYLKSMKFSIQTTNFGSKKQETFYISEYAGIIFNNIRKLYNIDKENYISSISPQDFITEMLIGGSTIIEELVSTGKSGSMFYYTRDGKYILKTISKTEYTFLKKILPNYYKHLCDNPYTYLPKFLGCYKLVKKIKKRKTRIHFVIMTNIFSTRKEIHRRYDIKGSKIGRQVIKNVEEVKEMNKYDFALKDLDLENCKQLFYIGVRLYYFKYKFFKYLTFYNRKKKNFVWSN